MSETPIIAGAQLVRRARFHNEAGALADPAGVVFATRAESGNTGTLYTYGTDNEVVRTGTGVYVASVVVPTSGKWFFEWWALDGNGTPQVKLGKQVPVLPSNVTP